MSLVRVNLPLMWLCEHKTEKRLKFAEDQMSMNELAVFVEQRRCESTRQRRHVVAPGPRFVYFVQS